MFPRTASAAAAAGLVACAVAGSAVPARAQSYDARRLGMGGIVVSDVLGSATQNVAFRAVPRPGDDVLGYNAIPIPLGVIEILADPPELDSRNENFNIFEIANLIGRTPWTLQLVEPEDLSSDVVIDIAQDELTVDLGELQRLFPDESIRYGMTFQSPNLEFGTSNVFAGVRPQAEGRNTLDLDPALHAALAEAAPFAPNTVYTADDLAQGQVALAFTGGAAIPLVAPRDAPGGDPRRGGFAVYAGARLKYLSGVALWRAEGSGTFTTGDTLFGASTPIETGYSVDVRDAADPKFGAGSGIGADAGVAVFVDGFEIGVGVNDIGSTIEWKDTNLRRFTYDSDVDEHVVESVERGTTYTSRFPLTGSLNLTWRKPGLTVGGTLDRTANERWIPRAGMETWAGPVPLRAGVYVDTYEQFQFTAGSGFKLGAIGLDVALATNSRGITASRGLELAASLAFYRGGVTP